MTRKTQLKPVPATTQIKDPAIRAIAEALKQNLDVLTGRNGQALDRVVTFRDFSASNVLKVTANGPGGAPQFAPGSAARVPDALNNLVAAGAFQMIVLSWSGSNGQRDYNHTEIFRNTTDDLGTAQLIGVAPGRAEVFADAVNAAGAWFYWVRGVNTDGIAGPFNAVAGTPGETATSAEYLKEQLTGQLTESEFEESLNERIDLIDADDTVAGSVNARIKSASDVLGSEISANANAITALDTRVTSAEGSITSIATDLISLETRVDDAETNIGGQATAITLLDARVASAEGQISAQASSISQLQTAVGENTATISEHASSIDGLEAQWSVKLDVNGHVAGFGLSSTPVDSVPTSEFIVLADRLKFGLPAGPWAASTAYAEGNYVKPTTGNNRIYRCMSAGTTGATEPTWPTTIGQQVTDGGVTWECREVQSNILFTLGSVGGVDTVVLDSAHIGDATITNAKIADATIDSAKIANLTADKIKGGVIGAEQIYLGGMNFKLDGSQQRLEVLDGAQTRLRLGLLPDSSFGLELFDPSGNKVIGLGGALYNDGTNINDLKPAAAGADNTAANTSGRGINLMPYRYCIFSEAAGLPPIATSNGLVYQRDYNATRNIYARYGSHFLELRCGGDHTQPSYFYLGESANDYNIPVEPGKSYLFHAAMNRSGTWVGGSNPHVIWRMRAAGGINVASKSFNFPAVNDEWPVYTMRVDVPAGVTKLLFAPYIPANAGSSSNIQFFLDGLQIEELQGDKEEPSAFSMPSPQASELDALETINGPLHPHADQTGARGTKDLLADDAGLGNRADFGAITGLPSTLAGYNITDAQKDLGPSNDVGQVLRRDLAGDTYWDDQYGSEINIGAWRPFDAITLVPATGAYEPVGQRVRIPNPGKYVYLACSMAVNAAASFANDILWWKLAVSWDGGATWSEAAHAANMTVENGQRSQGTGTWFYHGMPTGDILLELRVNQAAGDAQINITNHTIGSFQLAPRSEFALAGAALSVTLPDTRSGACAKSFGSGTTCTASTTVTANVAGGVEPVTHSWSKVSGSDSITSGATSETCTVSGTHTTADPAAQYQTVIKDTVTDSRSAGDGGPQVATSNNCTVTLSYLRTFEPVNVHVPDQTFGCAVSGGACTASGNLTRSVSGGDGNYSNAWTKRSGAGSITAGATSASCTVSNTATNTAVEGVFRCTVTDGRSASGFDDATATFVHRVLT